MDTKISEYQVVRQSDPAMLAKEVNRLIGEGFQPFGSLCWGNSTLFQPMVKEDKPEVKITEFKAATPLSVPM